MQARGWLAVFPQEDVRVAGTAVVVVEQLRVRAAAADALGLLGDGRAVGPLREHCADADPFVQNAALAALRRLGGG